MRVYLQTERMILREFTAADVDALVDLDSDPEVTRYINGGKPSPRPYIVEHVLPRILKYYQDLDRQGLWAVIGKQEEDFMGWFHLRPNRVNPAETELGYRFKQCYWGQGLATEGSQALLKKGFEELHSKSIVAIADPANGASIRVMQKIGMKYLGEFREPDDFLVLKYGLRANEYFRMVDHG